MKQNVPDAAGTGGERQIGFPFSFLREEMDQLFDKFLGSERFSLLNQAPLQKYLRPDADFIVPDVDVREDAKAITLSAELPGIEEKDISLKVHDGELTISGEKKVEHVEKSATRHVSERRYGRFERRFMLPKTVDETRIEAEFANGVLSIRLPKLAEAVKPEKRIPIRHH